MLKTYNINRITHKAAWNHLNGVHTLSFGVNSRSGCFDQHRCLVIICFWFVYGFLSSSLSTDTCINFTRIIAQLRFDLWALLARLFTCSVHFGVFESAVVVSPSKDQNLLIVDFIYTNTCRTSVCSFQ